MRLSRESRPILKCYLDTCTRIVVESRKREQVLDHPSNDRGIVERFYEKFFLIWIGVSEFRTSILASFGSIPLAPLWRDP